MNIKSVSELPEYEISDYNNGEFPNEDGLSAPSGLSGSNSLLLELSYKNTVNAATNDEKYQSQKFNFSNFTENVYSLFEKINSAVCSLSSQILNIDNEIDRKLQNVNLSIDNLSSYLSSLNDDVNGEGGLRSRLTQLDFNVPGQPNKGLVIQLSNDTIALSSRLSALDNKQNPKGLVIQLSGITDELSAKVNGLTSNVNGQSGLLTRMLSAEGEIINIENGGCSVYLNLSSSTQQRVGGKVKFDNTTNFVKAATFDTTIEGTARKALWSNDD